MPWEQIAQMGGTALVGCFAIWTILRLVANHINHNTDAINNLTFEIRALREDIKDILRDLISKK